MSSPVSAPAERTQKMQIKIRYDNHFQTVEITEAECEQMIRNDYEERRAAAADPSTVQPRTMQEIMDDRFNRPERNNGYNYRIHTADLDGCDFEGDAFVDRTLNVETDYEAEELLRELRAAISTLQPQQRELLYRIFQNGESQVDIASAENVSNVAVFNRLQRIYAVLRKKLKDF